MQLSDNQNGMRLYERMIRKPYPYVSFPGTGNGILVV